MSSTTLCSRDVRSVCRRGSLALSSRANCSVAPIMASISAMVDSILSRSCAFSTVSARSRSKRQRRAQIVRDGRQQARAVLDQTAQARLHVVEGTGRLPGLDGAGFGQRRGVDIVAEPFGGRCQRGKGCGHAADGPHGHGENDDCHDAHGKQELSGERGAAGRQGGRKREPRPSARGMETCRSRKAANPPKPCIIGPCPIMCQGPNGGPSAADADTRGCRAGPRDS